VRGPDLVVAALGQPGDRAAVEGHERLAQQRHGVERTLTTLTPGQLP
jgi:hypothetical protein